eukprot:364052-Chlamydomonas_euryale.AAC.5
MRAARETLDIDALLSEHDAATEQPRDDHALRVEADIAAATHGGVWLAPSPLAPAPPAPAPVPATALPIVSPLLGGIIAQSGGVGYCLGKGRC